MALRLQTYLATDSTICPLCQLGIGVPTGGRIYVSKRLSPAVDLGVLIIGPDGRKRRTVHETCALKFREEYPHLWREAGDAVQLCHECRKLFPAPGFRRGGGYSTAEDAVCVSCRVSDPDCLCSPSRPCLSHAAEAIGDV